ncbi:MAG: hypothetical protein WC654_06005 [Patescibacteria group bacterium]
MAQNEYQRRWNDDGNDDEWRSASDRTMRYVLLFAFLVASVVVAAVIGFLQDMLAGRITP